MSVGVEGDNVNAVYLAVQIILISQHIPRQFVLVRMIATSTVSMVVRHLASIQPEVIDELWQLIILFLRSPPLRSRIVGELLWSMVADTRADGALTQEPLVDHLSYNFGE